MPSITASFSSSTLCFSSSSLLSNVLWHTVHVECILKCRSSSNLKSKILSQIVHLNVSGWSASCLIRSPKLAKVLWHTLHCGWSPPSEWIRMWSSKWVFASKWMLHTWHLNDHLLPRGKSLTLHSIGFRHLHTWSGGTFPVNFLVFPQPRQKASILASL